MRSIDRASLVIIAVALLLVSPLNIIGMLWDHIIYRSLMEIYIGVTTWGVLFIAGALVVYALIGNGDGPRDR